MRRSGDNSSVDARLKWGVVTLPDVHCLTRQIIVGASACHVGLPIRIRKVSQFAQQINLWLRFTKIHFYTMITIVGITIIIAWYQFMP